MNHLLSGSIVVLSCFAALSMSHASSAEPESQPAASQLTVDWEQSDLGETTIVPMKNAPFPHASREQGFKIDKKVFPREPHYVDNSVAIFIPNGFRLTDKIDALVYLHGHYNNIRKALDQYKLREQIVASGRNLILIFPEGPKDAGDSGCGKLEEPGGLRRIVEEAVRILHVAGRTTHEHIGRVLIAGHSGAYQGISYCVEHGGMEAELADVALLDASYGRLDAFVDWVARDRSGTFFSIFTDHLAARNVYLMTHLHGRKINYALWAEQDVPQATVARERVLFLHAEKLNHETTVGWLERWLKSRSVPTTSPAR